jgi:DNA polymerase
VALQELAVVADACQKCEVLSSCRKKVVFGEGNPGARFLFFGEGPGADEDQTGRPFIGKAGQLLTKMIAACTLDRDQCYITNTVKCRPPGNRNPEHDEIENCRSFYEQQIDLIRPEYIICLGAIAASELLRTKLSVGRLRGKLHQYRGSKVLVTYHPAYLLRNPAAKKAAWQDLQFLMADAGIKLP